MYIVELYTEEGEKPGEDGMELQDGTEDMKVGLEYNIAEVW